MSDRETSPDDVLSHPGAQADHPRLTNPREEPSLVEQLESDRMVGDAAKRPERQYRLVDPDARR